MSNQFDMFSDPEEVLIFGAEGYKNIHHDITHCHICYPAPQATLVKRDNKLPGYRFKCQKCKAKWKQTDTYIKDYSEADKRIVNRFPFLTEDPDSSQKEGSQDG